MIRLKIATINVSIVLIYYYKRNSIYKSGPFPHISVRLSPLLNLINLKTGYAGALHPHTPLPHSILDYG